MHTGYDKMWMHNNSRLKPVLNLPKNDNCSQAQLTDSYKQLQKGGCPRNLNSFIPYQNSAASSHENDQYRNSYDQSMWPSSIYSLPFMSLYANNPQSQESFSAHPSNFAYSLPNSQAQGKHDFKHLEIPGNNENGNTHIPRIRVKDVYSLNNGTPPNHLRLDGSFFQTHRKEWRGCSSNFAAIHCNNTSGSQTQMGYVNYEKYSLMESRKPPQYKQIVEQSCLHSQDQLLQHSGSFYQENLEFSSKKFEFRQVENSSMQDAFETSSPAALLKQLLHGESVPHPENQNRKTNVGAICGGIQTDPETNVSEPKTANADYSRLCHLRKRLIVDGPNLRNAGRAHHNLQESPPEIGEAGSMSRKYNNIMSVTSKSPPPNENNNEENCLIKISVPHTGESSFIRLSDCGGKNSNFSFRSFDELNDKHCGVGTESLGRINVEKNTFINSLSLKDGLRSRKSPSEADFICTNSDVRNNRGTICGNLISPSRNVDLTNQSLPELVVDVNNKENNFLSNSNGAVHQELGMKNSSSDEVTEQEIPLSDISFTPLILKQEIFNTTGGGLQPAQNIGADEVLQRVIKTENTSEDFAVHQTGLQPSENVPSDAKVSNKPKRGSGVTINSGDSAQSVKTLKSNSNESQTSRTEAESDGQEMTKEAEVDIQMTNYKSNINRDKLDMLIQFLKKGEAAESGCSKGACEDKDRHSEKSFKTTNNDNGKRKEEINANPNRRKLSKTCIVRNKNNSREMVSLMSLKSSNCAPKPSQIAKVSKESEDDGEGKCGGAKDGLTADVSEKLVKCNNPCRENEMKEHDTSLSGNENACLRKQLQDSPESASPKDMCAAQEEKTLINAMRAFQNFKTHFCMSCNLVSSIDSFWINVVSGELRCLNCFKKMALKAEENVLKSKTLDAAAENRKSKTECKTKGEPKDEDTSKRCLKCEGVCRKSSDLKENMKQELSDVFGSPKYRTKSDEKTKKYTNYSCGVKRKRSGSGDAIDNQKGKSPGEQKVLKAEKSARNSRDEMPGKRPLSISKQEMEDLSVKRKRKTSGEEDFFEREKTHSSSKPRKGQLTCTKEQRLGEGAKQELIIKSERSVGKSTSTGDETSENHYKKERKPDASPSARRNPEKVKEEFRCHKFVEEHVQREAKQSRHCAEESARKSLSKEGSQKDQPAVETAKKIAKHEPLEKSKSQNDWRESRDHQKSKTCKHFGPDIRKSASNQNTLESHKRMEPSEQAKKRKNLDETSGSRKVHVGQELLKKEITQRTFATKSSEARTADDGDASQGGNLDCERIKGSAEKSRKSSLSKDECGEQLKGAKSVFDSWEKIAKDVLKGHVVPQREKSKAGDSSRKRSKEKPTKEESNSVSRRPSDPSESEREAKRESVSSENGERRKSEEIKRPSEKPLKLGSPEGVTPTKETGRCPETFERESKHQNEYHNPRAKFRIQTTI